MNNLPDDEDDTPPPDDDEEHPSTLGLLCESPEPPQPFEVMQRLEDAGYKLEILNEDAWDDAVWARVLKVDESPHALMIWCQRRSDDFRPWEWAPARWRDQEEFELTRKSRWMVMLQTFYEPDEEPNDHFHAHIKLADVVAEGLATACMDTNAMLLRSKTSLHELAECKVAPAPEEMYQIHAISDGDMYWLHTHGLRRFEVPELELIGVPREHLEDAYTAFQWLVAYVLPVFIPTGGIDLSFGADVAIRLVPFERVIERRPADSLAGSRDREAPEHRGWRLVVCDQRDDGRYSIEQFLRSVQGDPIFWLSDEESDRRAHLARGRFGLAAAAWYSTQFKQRRMGIKAGVPYNDAREDLSDLIGSEKLPKGVSREHMWFELQAIESKLLVAKLESEPVFATYMKRGEVYRLPLSQLSEFNLILDGQYYNPTTISELDTVTLRTGRKS
ncbi:MAG: DUF4026 domain-containing protein [Planctomycetota bacterium]